MDSVLTMSTRNNTTANASPSRLPTHQYATRNPSKLSVSVSAASSPVADASSAPSTPTAKNTKHTPSKLKYTPTNKTEKTNENSSSASKRQPLYRPNPSSALTDSAFEFNAPKFCDFTKLDADDDANPWAHTNALAPSAEKGKSADSWFDEHRSSPQIGSSHVADPSELLEQLGDDDYPTPKASKTRPATAGPHHAKEHHSRAAVSSQQDLSHAFAGLTLTQSGPKRTLLADTVASKMRAAAAAAAIAKAATSDAVTAKKPAGPTIPKEFSFMTRSSKSAANKQSEQNATQNKPKPIQRKQNMTIAAPFKFHETHHRSNTSHSDETSKSPFVPLVNKLKQFETDTSERFKSKPKETQNSHMQQKPTKPHSPTLITKQRSKPTNMKTTEEMLMEEIRSYPRFKARHLDKKILKEPHIGVPPVEKPPLTIPQSPHFSKRPVHSAPPAPPQPKVIKANPIRYANSKPFEVVLEHRQIIPDEVHLPSEEIRLRKIRELEEARKAKEAEEEKMRMFVARPLPDLAVPDMSFASGEFQPLPEVKPRPVTEPEPFNLLTQSLLPRSAFAKSDGTFEINCGDLVGGPGAPGVKFKAQPIPIVEPFVPKKSSKAPTVPVSIALHTDERMEERRAFDKARALREAIEQEMKEIARLENEEYARQETLRLRSEQVFHAQPIRHFPGIQIHASQKRLTEPESPMLKEKRQRLERMKSMLGRLSPTHGKSNGSSKLQTNETDCKLESVVGSDCDDAEGIPSGEFFDNEEEK